MLKLYCVIANHFFVILNFFCGLIERDLVAIFQGCILKSGLTHRLVISDRRPPCLYHVLLPASRIFGL
jgi:hypothetical protein